MHVAGVRVVVDKSIRERKGEGLGADETYLHPPLPPSSCVIYLVFDHLLL